MENEPAALIHNHSHVAKDTLPNAHSAYVVSEFLLWRFDSELIFNNCCFSNPSADNWVGCHTEDGQRQESFQVNPVIDEAAWIWMRLCLQASFALTRWQETTSWQISVSL